MHRLLLAGLLVLAGCQGVVGPAQRRCVNEPIDYPCLTPDEQRQRARDQLALPQGSPTIGPRTYAEEPARRGP